jgi:hypothetical protein
MKHIKLFEQFVAEARKFGVKDMMKAFKNKEDWDDAANKVYMKAGNLVVVDTWFYGESKAMKQLEDSWKTGGTNYDYWNKEYGLDFKIVDTFSEVRASGRHKKLTSDGIVGVVLKVIESVNEVKDSINEAKKFKIGDMWSDDFDYSGMLAAGLKADVNTPIKKLNKLLDSFTDVNYHTEAQGLGIAIDWIDDGDKKGAKEYMDMFHKACKEALKTNEAVKAYMSKIDLKDFKKIKKGSKIQYMGASVEVVSNDGYVLELKDNDGKITVVNKGQFDHGGRISEVASSTDGGDKSNGNSHHEDHKEKGIAQHWKDTYGEEFHSKYPAIAKIVKSRPGMDKRELKRIWVETYGENFEEQYPALWQKLD